MTKVTLLFIYLENKIYYKKIRLISVTEYRLWKSENAIFWWLSALLFFQTWKELFEYIFLGLKDCLILIVSLENVLSWIVLMRKKFWSIRISPFCPNTLLSCNIWYPEDFKKLMIQAQKNFCMGGENFFTQQKFYTIILQPKNHYYFNTIIIIFL